METEMELSTLNLSTMIYEFSNSTVTEISPNSTVENFSYCTTVKSPMSNIILVILFGAVCFVGIIGNSLVIFVVLKFNKMKTITNNYILNLALADEFFLIGIPFLIVTIINGEWIFGDLLCKFYMISTSITQFSSSIFLLIMSADRYVAVCHPIESPRYRNVSVSKMISICSWLLSLVLMTPVIFYANTIGKTYPDDVKRSCIIKWPQTDGSPDDSSRNFILYSFSIGFAVPLSLIVIFYYRVIRKLQSLSNKSKNKKRSHRKVTTLVLTIVTCYIVFWSPYWTMQIFLISSPEHCKTKVEVVAFVLAGCLGYSNSSINPLLYAFLSENFRKSFLEVCTCAVGNELNLKLQTDNSLYMSRLSKNRCSEKKISMVTKINRIEKCNGNVSSALIEQNTRDTDCDSPLKQRKLLQTDL